jgi:hypothetical protein
MGMQGGSGGMGGVPPLDNIRRYRTAFTREQVILGGLLHELYFNYMELLSFS